MADSSNSTANLLVGAGVVTLVTGAAGIVAKGFGLELGGVDSVGAQVALVTLGSAFLGSGIWLLKSSPAQGLGIAFVVLLIGLVGIGATAALGPDNERGNGNSVTSTTAPSDGDSTSGGPPPQTTSASAIDAGNDFWETSASGTVGDLTVRVLRVDLESNGQATLTVEVVNGTSDSLSLPLFGYFSATDGTGETILADVGASNWPTSFAQGATGRGEIRLDDWFVGGSGEFRIDFSQVFGSFDVDSISVEGIPING